MIKIIQSGFFLSSAPSTPPSLDENLPPPMRQTRQQRANAADRVLTMKWEAQNRVKVNEDLAARQVD